MTTPQARCSAPGVENGSWLVVGEDPGGPGTVSPAGRSDYGVVVIDGVWQAVYPRSVNRPPRDDPIAGMNSHQ